jgi:SAM-dependent methyltransferase
MSSIDKRLQTSVELFKKLANSNEDSQVKVGRSSADAEKEKHIFKDINAKLSIQPGDKVLSVGVGCGQIALWWLQKAVEMDLTICFFDFPDVIRRIASEIVPNSNIPEEKLCLIEGIFPLESNADLTDGKFDRIDLYSVIHYTDQPLLVVDSAVSLLAPGGRLLIGDIPNLDKKGRFLSSQKGREFEAEYKKLPLEQIPIYKDHKSFTLQAIAAGTPHLDDKFIFFILQKYRDQGMNAYVLDQPAELPFCHTREDVLICSLHG